MNSRYKASQALASPKTTPHGQYMYPSTMDQEPKTRRLFGLFTSGGKNKMHSGMEQYSRRASPAQSSYSSSYLTDPVSGPVSSRSQSPATHWPRAPSQNLMFSQDGRKAEPVGPGYTTSYTDNRFPVEKCDPSLYTDYQSLDVSARNTTRQLIIGIDFVS